ncbi:MAG: beta-galactosidase [Lentisphaeria bacterium]|nr:beta-galactosidase [Lentisphaeria bacterium]
MKRLLLMATTLVSFALAAQPYLALVDAGGSVKFQRNDRALFSLSPGLYAEGWRGVSVVPASTTVEGDGPREGRLRVADDAAVSSSLVARLAGDAIELRYTLTPQAEVRLNSLHASFSLPESFLKGASYTIAGEAKPVPAERDVTHLRTGGPVPSVRFAWPDGDWLEVELLSEVPVLFQDSRQWGPTFDLRIGAQPGEAQAFAAGQPIEVALRVRARDGLRLEFDQPVTIKADDTWVPLAAELDIEPGSALDFSGFGQLDAPAGKHGWLQARPDGQFVFANSPDQARKFYGVNFCFSAQYLENEQAEQVAERLMRLGYNTVRFHHYEGTLIDRSQGRSTDLNPERLAQLDYLFAALKRRGLYITTDCYVSRPVLAAEIWPGTEGNVAMDEFKMLVPVNERAFANWAAFTRNLLTHRNPHTGLRYADDPALAWLSMINEANFGNFIGRLSDRARPDWERAWGLWLKGRYANAAAVAEAWGTEFAGDWAAPSAKLSRSYNDDNRQSRDFAVFLAETERDMFVRMRSFLRDEIGTQALLTNMNGWSNTLHSQLARAEYDYVDDHFYVDHPNFIEQSWRLPSRCANTSPVLVGAPGGRQTAFNRIYGKPFTISEYNYSGPGRFRGVGGILTGCMAAVQDWSVVWRFAYSHSKDNMFRPGTAGYFDLATDPLNQAAERASICLFLRGDMAPAPRGAAITLDPAALRAGTSRQGGTSPGWSALVSVIQVGTMLGNRADRTPVDIALPETDAAPQGAELVIPEPFKGTAGEAIVAALRERGWLAEGNLTDLGRKRGQSANNQFLMDGERDMMVLDTPRTAGGYAPAGQTVRTAAADFAIGGGEGATIWISSLDDQPIVASQRLLLTHLTDLQNTEIRYAERTRQTLLAWGKLPHLVRAGEARVTLRRTGDALPKVYVLATSGRRLGEVPVRRDAGGALVLDISTKGADGAQLLYELDFR